jgi:hypothetical protein
VNGSHANSGTSVGWGVWSGERRYRGVGCELVSWVTFSIERPVSGGRERGMGRESRWREVGEFVNRSLIRAGAIVGGRDMYSGRCRRGEH